MKHYFVQLRGREEGPYTDEQVAQMFADGRVNQHTPCKTEALADWRTIDDFLPTLKYGSERPAGTVPTPAVSGLPGTVGGAVKIADVDVPFASILKMMFKVYAALLIVTLCFVPVILLFWFLFFAGLVTFLERFAH
jgi:hypothetical protein